MTGYKGIYPTIDYKDSELLFQVAKDGDTLKVQGIWKEQQFVMSIPAKVEPTLQEAPNDNSIDVNSPEMLQYIEMCTKDAEVVVIELNEYQKDLMQLQEQCREGAIDALAFGYKVIEISHKYGLSTTHIIAELFAC